MRKAEAAQTEAAPEKIYAFVSHESAVVAIWWIAEHHWEGLLDDEGVASLVLTLPLKMGGFGLPRPSLNYGIPVDGLLRDLSPKQDMIADLCWPEEKVLLEYHGWKEHFGRGPKGAAFQNYRQQYLSHVQSCGFSRLDACCR